MSPSPPAPSRSHAGAVARASSRGRGSRRAAGSRASHRSDSPTPARGVGSGGGRTWSTVPSAVLDAACSRVRCSRLRSHAQHDDPPASFVQWSEPRLTPLATSERRSGTSPKGILHTARGCHLWWLPRVMRPRRTSILKGLLKDVGGEWRRESRVPLLKEPLQGSGVLWMARNPG